MNFIISMNTVSLCGSLWGNPYFPSFPSWQNGAFKLLHSVAENHQNSQNRQSLRKHNSRSASKFLACPKQSTLQHSWGNNLLRPLPFTFCSPRHGPKTPKNSRLILLPSARGEDNMMESVMEPEWRLCLTSLSHCTVQCSICYSLNWPISNDGRIINQAMKRKLKNPGFKTVLSRGSHHIYVWKGGSVAWN